MALEFDVSKISGLSEEIAAKRLIEEGFNELPSSKKRSSFKIAFEVFSEPMFLLLVACGVVYFILGDLQEAVMLLGFVFVIMGITLYQERKTENALEALKDLSSPRALVLRNGLQKRIAGREVVKEDIIFLSEGDRVPADAVIIACINLSVDESFLTGESIPVRKMPAKEIPQTKRPGGDDLPFVFSGTLIVQGQGIARVFATGINTEIGKIGKALKTLEPEKTFIQKETEKLVKNLAVFGLSLCVIVVVVYGITRHNWMQGFLAGIALAMATLPEEFPVVLTVFLAIGAWRISQKQVLTRRIPAVETLGSTTVLCVDKTGTLTMNKMFLSTLFCDGVFHKINGNACTSLPEKFHETLEFSILASQKNPFDPMEKAVQDLGNRTLSDTEHIHNNWTLIQEYPLDPALLAMSRVWKSPDGNDYIIACKGAPEAILDLCHLPEDESKELLKQVKVMADNGLRVLGAAKADFKQTSLPVAQHDFKFKFLGFLGLEDPVRPTAPLAIQECYRAGIRVIMITGDYPVTAQNIGRQIGLKSVDQYITGPELDSMTDEELLKKIQTVSIFARVVPEQKLRIVTALKTNKEIVAMTGDGVNDSPALKAANIGIAMGAHGTDVAREASALVLIEDDFSSIVAAVKMGRRIFDNLKNAMSYIFAIHIPIAGMTLIPVLFKWPLVLLPVHIVFLELIIDPACSVVFEAEPEESNVMNRPPRAINEPLFGQKTILYSFLQGFGVLVTVLAAFYFSYKMGHSELQARSLTFTTLIFANLGLILSNRSRSQSILETFKVPNKALWFVLSGATVFLGLVLYVPFLRKIFQFTILHPIDLIVCISAAMVSIFWCELLKIIYKKN